MVKRYIQHSFYPVLKTIGLIGIVLSLISCEKESSPVSKSDLEIDQTEIVGSLSPWSLIDDPEYVNSEQARDIADHERVFVYKGEDQVYIYPTGEMTHVEVVNDRIDGIPLAVTYCPLTKSGIAWRRNLMNDTLRFAPSGLLYNSNLLAYDFETESIWSQMRIEAIQGDRNKQKLQLLPLLDIPWGSIKNHFPKALIFTGKNKSSSHNRLNSDQSFLNYNEITSHHGERVFGLLKGKQIDIYPMELFDENTSILKNTSNDNVIIVGSTDHEFVSAFETSYAMSPVHQSFPVVMKDNSGSYWNIFGEAIEGPRKGERLSVPTAYSALFWAWEGVFKEKTIHVN